MTDAELDALAVLSDGPVLDQLFESAQQALFSQIREASGDDERILLAARKLDVLQLVKQEFRKLIGDMARKRSG